MLTKIQNKNFELVYHKACNLYTHSHKQNIKQRGTDKTCFPYISQFSKETSKLHKSQP